MVNDLLAKALPDTLMSISRTPKILTNARLLRALSEPTVWAQTYCMVSAVTLKKFMGPPS